jgi:hypothetical protein
VAGRVFFCPRCGAYLPESVERCPCGLVIPAAGGDKPDEHSHDEPAASFLPDSGPGLAAAMPLPKSLSATTPPDLSVETSPPAPTPIAKKTTSLVGGVLLGLVVIIAGAVLYLKVYSTSARLDRAPGALETASGTGNAIATNAASVTHTTAAAGTDVSGPSDSSPASIASFLGQWQLQSGEFHPVTKQVVKSFLTISGTAETPTVVWKSELDGSIDHTISLKNTHGTLRGDYYGGKDNVVIQALGDGRLSFTIDPYAEFAPIKNSIYAKQVQPGVPAETYPAYLSQFIGTWETNDHGGLLEISYVDNRLRIRDCADPNATSGVEYFARYSNGEIVAVGDPHDFYKFQLPSFKILPNGELHIDCGACVDGEGLKKSAKAMPVGVKYAPPVNDD